MEEPKSKAPIVNCHAHVFTGDYVPPLLGKALGENIKKLYRNGQAQGAKKIKIKTLSQTILNVRKSAFSYKSTSLNN